jgi:hypothetical protein
LLQQKLTKNWLQEKRQVMNNRHKGLSIGNPLKVQLWMLVWISCLISQDKSNTSAYFK